MKIIVVFTCQNRYTVFMHARHDSVIEFPCFGESRKALASIHGRFFKPLIVERLSGVFYFGRAIITQALRSAHIVIAYALKSSRNCLLHKMSDGRGGDCTFIPRVGVKATLNPGTSKEYASGLIFSDIPTTSREKIRLTLKSMRRAFACGQEFLCCFPLPVSL
jgi:hypothetical protein